MQKTNFRLGVLVFATFAGAFSAFGEPVVTTTSASGVGNNSKAPLISLAAGKKPIVQKPATEEQDGWHSSNGLYNEWPQLGSEDCSRYGARYGYSECGKSEAPRKIPEKNALSEAASKPETDAAKPRIDAVKAKISAGKLLKPQIKPEQRLLSVKTQKFVPPLPERRWTAVNVASPQTKETVPPKADADSSNANISRMLIMSFDGVSESSEGVRSARSKLEQNLAAHIMIAPDNLSDRDQAKALIAYLKQGRPQRDGLLGVEFPGGELVKSGVGSKAYPTPLDIGQSDQPQTAHALYKGMAGELAELGINMNFSPILGLNSAENASANSFGADPLHAASFATAYIHGHMDAGVITSLSHFAVSGDNTPSADLQASSAVYREIFKKQLGDAVTINGENFAASIKTLRDDLGFRGVIIADFQNLAADGDNGPVYQKAVVEAVNAGADLLLVKSSTLPGKDQVTLAAEALRAASQSGAIVRDRLSSSIANVQALRKSAEARLVVRQNHDTSVTRIDGAGEAVKSN